MSGAAVHDQVLDGSSHTRLGSANVSDGLASDGMTADHGPQLPQTEQLRTWNRAASPNGRFSRERSQPVPRNSTGWPTWAPPASTATICRRGAPESTRSM